MPKGYISNRQRNLRIGITSYTENQTVLEVTGNTNISGIITSTSYYGDGSNLSGIVTSIIAGNNITVTNSNGEYTIGIGSTPSSNYLISLTPSFNGITSSFTMQYNGNDYEPLNEQQLIVSIGGVIQNPGLGYTVGESTIYFPGPLNSETDYFIVALNSLGSGSSGESTPATLDISPVMMSMIFS
jgi:hypothetical protein